MAILDQYAPTVLAELLPNDDGSTVDYGERVVDVRILGRQPSRSIHLNGNQRFYEGYLQMVRSWVSPDGLTPRDRDINEGVNIQGRIQRLADARSCLS